MSNVCADETRNKGPALKMKMAIPSLAIATLCAAACGADVSTATLAQLRQNGAFEFPQREAKILYDNSNLRVSVWNNGEFLFAQAVLWIDNDSSLGKTEDQREIGDWSELMLDLNADAKATPNVDRNYMLNPWPNQEGLHYTICLGDRVTTSIISDSKGRGAIRYVEFPDGKQVRVDTYLIPLAEISKQLGDTIRICYWGESPKPVLIVSSAGYKPARNKYYGYDIPLSEYHDYVLAQGGEIDSTKVPEGRNDISLSHRKKVAMPQVGQAAPEISAKYWINLEN